MGKVMSPDYGQPEKLGDYELIVAIAAFNAQSKALEEKLKALKKEAQDRFPIGKTQRLDVMVTITEIAKPYLDAPTLKSQLPDVYAQYEKVSVYKTVKCEKVGK